MHCPQQACNDPHTRADRLQCSSRQPPALGEEPVDERIVEEHGQEHVVPTEVVHVQLQQAANSRHTELGSSHHAAGFSGIKNHGAHLGTKQALSFSGNGRRTY